MPQMLECTFLALQFSLRCKTCFLDEPTVVWHQDTPGSESKSRAYALGHISALETLLELPIPVHARRRMRVRLTDARHGVADLHLREHDLMKAWPWHLRSLTGQDGWRYLPFGLKLLLAAVRGPQR